MPAPERFSFVIDKEDTQRVAILDEKERSYGQKERIRRLSRNVPRWIWDSGTRIPAWSSKSEISSSTGMSCCCA